MEKIVDYSKYYTPLRIAKRLIGEVDIDTPQHAIDICCGSCNLLHAAKNRWPQLSLWGVDINSIQNDEPVCFSQADGREYALANSGKFDLVVANPPFGYNESIRRFPELFNGEFENISSSRIEVEMLVANLLLLSPNGTLLIILPSSIVEGEKCNSLRRLLAENYCVEKLIKLDVKTFGSSMINSYALIIKNVKKRRSAKRISYMMESSKQENTIIPIDKLLSGEWVSNSCSYNRKLWDIKRGTISSACFTKKGTAILHTSKPQLSWEPQIKYISKKLAPQVFVECGDIIVSRVGRSAGEWCVYDGERMPISDCLFRIKDLNGFIAQKISGKKYDKEKKGVTTKYITYSDFIDWIESV